MLHYAIDSLETKIYAVHDDLSYKEVASVDQGCKLRPKPIVIILKQNKGRTKSLFNDEFFAHSNYTFYDTAANETTINISDWSLLKVFEPENRSREVFFSISDPLGEIRNISNLKLHKFWTEYFQIDGICNIIKFIRSLSKYPDWSYYDLMTENVSLKLTVNNLNSKIQELTNRITALESGET